MAWDGHQFVLFGGVLPDNGSGNPTALADTWIWTGAEWVQACGDPLAPCGPAPRVLAGFSELASPDPAQQGALLVGGLDFGGTDSPPSVLGDIWFWNGSAWIKQVSPWPDSTTLDIGAPTGVPLVGSARRAPCDLPSEPRCRHHHWARGADQRGARCHRYTRHMEYRLRHQR